METVEVSEQYQITLPSGTRRELGIEAGDRLMAVVQGGMLLLMPQPRDYVQAMAGLHREVWQGIDTTAYLREERGLWASQD